MNKIHILRNIRRNEQSLNLQSRKFDHLRLSKYVYSTLSNNELDRAGVSGYFLELQPIKDSFYEDIGLQKYIDTIFTSGKLDEEVRKDWERFGQRCQDELEEIADEMERYKPELNRYHVNGQLKSKVITSSAWKRMKSISAEEGLVAIGYEKYRRIYTKQHRIHQFVKLHMFGPVSGLFDCPLAMTDGACKLAEINLVNNNSEKNDVTNYLKMIFHHCSNRDPAKFWTSGQWMTERGGGSDVQFGTRTIAVESSFPHHYLLSGYKWFSSAADGEIAITLAKIKKSNEVQKKVSCFATFTRHKLSDGHLSDKIDPAIKVVQLKDKLGTRQLPTAELELTNLDSVLIGDEGSGIKTISSILNNTRMYNAVAATGRMSRALLLAKRYASARQISGGVFLSEVPLHLHTLLMLEVTYRSALYLTLDTIRLLQNTELTHENICSEIKDDLSMFSKSDSNVLLRLFTPIIKLYTAKHSVQIISECIECLGGIGYLEQSSLPRLLRDAQVLPVWEGTTNIMSLDIVRVLKKEKQNIDSLLFRFIESKVKDTPYENIVLNLHSQLSSFLTHKNIDFASPHIREVAYTFSRLLALSCLIGVYRLQPNADNKFVIEAFLSSEDLRNGQILSPSFVHSKSGFSWDIDLASQVVFGNSLSSK